MLKEVKFTATEAEVMQQIEQKGEFSWQEYSKPYKFEKALKELMWKEFITRKRDNGSLVVNVFVPTTYGTMAIENNKTAKLLNK